MTRRPQACPHDAVDRAAAPAGLLGAAHLTRLDDLPYPIVVDDEVASHVGVFIRAHGRPRCIVLADRNVAERAQSVAGAIGRKTPVLTFALDERRKTLRTLGLVLDALADAGADRTTMVVGIGGGVAGDLFGFAAATYMRGVPFVNVATSLVAMVDAAVGGKTGVDLRAGKNLAGAFADPRAVFCDLGALATLPARYLRDGLAELVKHGIIEGGEAFDALETLAPHPLHKWPWETVVAESLHIKAMYVREDRLEAGAREVLNLGHTFAHALERTTRYRMTHGAAVAVGLRAAGLLALRTGRFSEADHLRVLALLTLLRLPLIAPASADTVALLAAMAHDKKTRSGSPRFVLPRALGDVEYGVHVPVRSVRSVLTNLGSPPDRTEVIGRAARR